MKSNDYKKSNSVVFGDIEFLEALESKPRKEVFCVPGGGKIEGRANAVRAAKNLAKSNEKLRLRELANRYS